MSDPATAGQFNIVDGQLVELIDTKGTLLYANVGMQMNASETYLPVTFSTTKNTYGRFLIWIDLFVEIVYSNKLA